MAPSVFLTILESLPLEKMKRKKPTKRKPTKKAIKKTPLKTVSKHVKGTRAKSIEFTKGRKDPEKVVDTLLKRDWSDFDYLRRKNKPNGKNYKPPQGITVVVEVKKGRNTYHYTKLSPFDFVVNKQSVKQFTAETVNDLMSKYDTVKDSMEEDENEEDTSEASQYIENLDPSFIKSVTVRFFYGK